jgi:DNA-binding CsgD family transcriptional regulator
VKTRFFENTKHPKSVYMKALGAILGLFILCGNHSIQAQGLNIGVPPVWNFSKKQYHAGTQNWDATQDAQGIMYWANNEGLLQYNGNQWTCLPVNNKTVVRAVACAADGRIYVGAQSDLGYFSPNQAGQLQYHSLTHLLPQQKQNFEDVWDIAFWENQVFFRTNKSVFQFDGTQFRIHEPTGELTALFSTEKGLFIQKDLKQLLRLEPDGFKPFLQLPSLNSPITGMIHWSSDTILLASLKDGFFYISPLTVGRWNTANDVFFKEKRIYSATKTQAGGLAIGTSLDGLIIIDQYRRISRHLNKKNGLQNNNILSTFADRSGNIWLGLDSGIDCVIIDAPFSTVIPDNDLEGTGYAAAVYRNRLYLGVSSGVYNAPWQSFYNPDKGPYFEKIKSTDGQVWRLSALDDQLWLGHHDGAFILDAQQNIPLSKESGAWNFVPLSSEYLLGGTYNGLSLYQKKAGKWTFVQQLSGLSESCRFMVRDDQGTIWVSHPYRGVYRVQWRAEQPTQLKVDFYNSKNGLPADLNNFVFQVAGKAIFATEKGIFKFQNDTQRFVPDEDFNEQLKDCGPLRYLKEDQSGHIWYVGQHETGVLLIDDNGIKKTVKKRVFPELAEKMVAGFEFIYPVDSENIFFGAEQGFIHFNARAVGMDSVFQVVLSQVTATGLKDSLIFGGYFFGPNGIQGFQSEKQIPTLSANQRHLKFQFAATDFKEPAFLQYRIRLIGLNNEWSDWSDETVRDFTNLSPGKYTFQVQARRKDGQESQVLSYTFKIRPPWYGSLWAISFYALVFLSIFIFSLWRQRYKYEIEKEKLTVKHKQIAAAQEQEMEQTRIALAEIQNEKLEAEIRFKNQELASATMHLVQKGEILLTVQENLHEILNKSASAPVKKEIQQLLNLLNFDTKLDDDWEQFAFHFDQVHVDFLKKLREKQPQLSANDYKLCAYLRMNLSTKEIAPLMNISVRGVEASRYRLRKKLGLSNDANLIDVILSM